MRFDMSAVYTIVKAAMIGIAAVELISVAVMASVERHRAHTWQNHGSSR